MTYKAAICSPVFKLELDIENYIKESKIVYAFLRLLDNLLPTSPFMFKIFRKYHPYPQNVL